MLETRCPRRFTKVSEPKAGVDVERKTSHFVEGYFVLVTREAFHKGEDVCLCWGVPRRIFKQMSNYVYLLEYICKGAIEEMHISRLKFYHDRSLDKEAVMSCVLSSKTGMLFQHLNLFCRIEQLFNGSSSLARPSHVRSTLETQETHL